MKRNCLLFALILSLLLPLVMGSSMIASAEEPEIAPTATVKGHNLALQDRVEIAYYATFSNVPDDSELGILIWFTPQSQYEYGKETHKITEWVKDGAYQKFYFDKAAAKQMADPVYAVPYVKSGDQIWYGEVDKYSIVQYCFKKKDSTTKLEFSSITLGELVTEILEYGAAAQKYFNHNTHRLANGDWHRIDLTAGCLDDGTNHGLYLAGDTVTLTAPQTNAAGGIFSYWEDSKGRRVASTMQFDLTIGDSDEVYTPVYIQGSSGLLYDSNGDGTCYVIGIENNDIESLVIPAFSPDGDEVIGIDRNAFVNGTFTNVTIPNTVREIGRNAFSGCTSLTDVYYEDTEESWEEVYILSGNVSLENATKHFVENEIVDSPYTLLISSNVGEENASAYFDVILNSFTEKDGKTVNVTLSIENIKQTINGVVCQVCYDTERLTLTTPKNGDNSLGLVAEGFGDRWENLTTEANEGVIEFCMVVADDMTQALNAKGTYTVTFTFQLKEGFKEAGIWVPCKDNKGSMLNFQQCDGNGSYTIATT